MDRYLKPLVQIPPEKGTHTCNFAFTITLKPYMYQYPPEVQLARTSGDIKRMFYNCRMTMIAELTKQCNIHYHGILAFPIKVKNPTLYFFNRLRGLPKALGKSECSQLIDEDKWVTYLNKDIKENIKQDVFYPTIIDDYGIINEVALDEVEPT